MMTGCKAFTVHVIALEYHHNDNHTNR